MKFIKNVTSILLVSLPLISASRADEQFYMKTPQVYSKFTGLTNETIRIKSYSSTKRTILLTLNLYYHNGHNLYSTQEKTIKLNPGFPVLTSLTLTLNGRMSKGGVDVEINLSENDNKLNISKTLLPYKKQVINTTNYKNKSCVIEGVMFDYQTTSLVVDEIFDFKDLNEYISLKDNNALDFSSIYFSYMDGYRFSCSDVSLHIKDYKDLYPNISKSGNEIILPMKYTINSNVISFDLNQTMYVNTKTLDMSDHPLDGYQETNELFIPSGKEDDFLNNENYIYISEAGYSNSDILIPLNFYFDHHYVGECYNSDYCVHGGIKQ